MQYRRRPTYSISIDRSRFGPATFNFLSIFHFLLLFNRCPTWNFSLFNEFYRKYGQYTPLLTVQQPFFHGFFPVFLTTLSIFQAKNSIFRHKTDYTGRSSPFFVIFSIKNKYIFTKKRAANSKPKKRGCPGMGQKATF